MKKASACTLPADSLLQHYLLLGDFVDCFSAQVTSTVSLAQFVTAFYSSRLFNLERQILSWLLGKGFTGAQLTALAQAEVNEFAAWTVEARQSQQLLLCDYRGRTRSWLMVASEPGSQQTRLYFGSAVIAEVHPETGERSMAGSFRALLGFHTLYSKALLNAAQRRLRKDRK